MRRERKGLKEWAKKKKMFALLVSSDGNGDSTMVTSGDGGCCFLQEQPLQKIPAFFDREFW